MDKQAKSSTKTDDTLDEARKRYHYGYERERKNIEDGIEDLEFRRGNQWPREVEEERIAEGKPVHTINVLPQFQRQVTGEMRKIRPAIKVVPVGDSGDEETAEAYAKLIRHIERRSDATGVYMGAADSQTACGMGAWRIITEYADETTFDQELRLEPIESPLGVIFDPDAIQPTREDAMWCFVPHDMAHDAYKEKYPGAPLDGWEDPEGLISFEDWYSEDYIRVAEYWCKKPYKRPLALMPDGTVNDLSEATPEEIAAYEAQGARIEKRDGYRIYRTLMTCSHVLEGPELWPGMHIPIVPLIGEEVRIGRERYRHGMFRYAKDSQRQVNYFASAESEAVMMQPKSPFIGTEKNFEKYKDFWQTANQVNHPFLPYTPDNDNGGAPPQRQAPPMMSPGISNARQRAMEDIQKVIGIYDASLGARSNETSGVAIAARKAEGDTGTYVYIDNLARSVRRTGQILVDLIPKIYDTTRTMRIIGDDGKIEAFQINAPMLVAGPEGMEAIRKNDLTVGTYDVAVTMGPSYDSQRQAASDGMIQFMQTSPEHASLFIDLIAKNQDWPLSDEIAERMEITLPPVIRAKIAEKDGKPLPQDMQAPPPDPVQQAALQMEMQTKQAEVAGKAADAEKKQAEADKAKLELQQMMLQLQAQAMQPAPIPAPQQDNGKLEAIERAVVQLQEVVSMLMQPPQPPPPDMAMMAPNTQPAPEAGFFMPEAGQPAPVPPFTQAGG